MVPFGKNELAGRVAGVETGADVDGGAGDRCLCLPRSPAAKVPIGRLEHTAATVRAARRQRKPCRRLGRDPHAPRKRPATTAVRNRPTTSVWVNHPCIAASWLVLEFGY